MTASVPAKWQIKRGVRWDTPCLVVRLPPCVRFDHVFDLALDCLQSQLGEVTDRSSGWAAIPV